MVIIELAKQRGAPDNHVFKEFRCRRYAVERALRWLIQHSPAYSGITIDAIRLQALPIDGQLDVPLLQLDPNDNDDDHDGCADNEDEGPAPLQHKMSVDEASNVEEGNFFTLELRRVNSRVFVVQLNDEEGFPATRPAVMTAIMRQDPVSLCFVRYTDDVSGFPLEEQSVHRVG